MDPTCDGVTGSHQLLCEYVLEIQTQDIMLAEQAVSQTKHKVLLSCDPPASATLE